MKSFMRLARLLAAAVCFAAPVPGATFGAVVASQGGSSYADIVLDEGRNRLYLVDSTVNRIDIYNYKTRTFLAAITTDLQPVSAALSRDGSFLYVTAYTNAALDVIDLSAGQLVSAIKLPANPEGVAVGSDGRVLITAVGTGTSTTNTLLIYDPSQSAATSLSSVPVAPPVSTPPVLPAPPGRIYNSYRSRLLATPDGKWIVGVNGNTATNKVVFLYESESGSVLRSRSVTNLSTALAISSDGSRFMAGPTLFDTQTLQVMAQENAANAPFAFPSGTAGNFNAQANQGGSVFSPDGTVLYGAFNIAPVGSTRPSVTELLVNDPDNLLIDLGVEMPENLAGKMVIDAAGANIYALSDSGFMLLPVGSISQSPLASPQAQTVLLTKDTCGALKATTASDVMTNSGKGKFTISVNPYTAPTTTPVAPGPFPISMPPTPATSITTPAPVAQAVNSGVAPQVNFTYSPVAGTNPGTIGPSDFLIASAEAINIPGNVHVYQNYQDSVSAGTIIPVPINALSTFGLADIVLDSVRHLVYIANSGLNRLEVFDTQKRAFLAPVKVGQLPIGMAFGSDGNTLYVANAGGESIAIVDLTKRVQTGRVAFPALPFNAAVPISAPVAIAESGRGPLFVMSSGGTAGTLWKIDGNQAIPRALNPAVFGTGAITVSGGTNAAAEFWSLAATPGGEYILLMTGTGNAYLYDYLVDDFTATKQILQTPITGFRGPVTAGPLGHYYAVGGTILNSSLTPSQGSSNGFSPAGRPVAGVAAVSSNQVALFTEPVRASATSAVADAGMVELYDPATGAPAGSAPALEGPSSVVIGANGAVTQFARTLAIDPAGSSAYILTATGLSIVSLAPISPGQSAASGTNKPSINPGGAVNLGDYTAALAPGGLLTIFGKNLGTLQTSTPPLVTLLGGMCLTLNGTPIPMELTSPGQINAQIPVTLAAGKYPLVVRSIDNQAISNPVTLTISKYAPAVLIGDSGQPAIFHADGSYVVADNAANRDETLTIYATGLGVTHGGTVVTGGAAPASPEADTDTVQVYFGNPPYKQAQMIVHSSLLVPGMVGVAQISVTVPGFHMKGKALPVTIKIGGVTSSITGPAAPYVSVN